jgi:NTP pyrophosphatase (non-canonical NTP hydrolase)
MDKDLETALKCIRMVAQYSLDERESRDEMASTLAYIIEEVTEALAKAKGTAS